MLSLEGDPRLWDGDACTSERLSSRVLCLSAVWTQVLCWRPVLSSRQPGDQQSNHRIFVKLNNLLFQVLCGPDYEERMVFASLSSHPQHLAQLRHGSQENSPHQHQSQNSSGHPPAQLRRSSSFKSSTPSLSSSSSPSSLVPMPLPPIQTMWPIWRNIQLKKRRWFHFDRKHTHTVCV